jgi:hypothetical protein
VRGPHKKPNAYDSAAAAVSWQMRGRAIDTADSCMHWFGSAHGSISGHGRQMYGPRKRLTFRTPKECYAR